MAFPLTIDGTVKLAVASPAQAADLARKLAASLVAKRASDVQATSNSVAFRVGVFRPVTTWNILVPITSGKITVAPGSPGSVSYCFSCARMLIFATGASIVFSILITSAPDNSVTSRVLVPLAAWAWLFGGNYFIAYLRLPAFIRQVIADSTTLVSD